FLDLICLQPHQFRSAYPEPTLAILINSVHRQDRQSTGIIYSLNSVAGEPKQAIVGPYPNLSTVVLVHRAYETVGQSFCHGKRAKGTIAITNHPPAFASDPQRVVA